MKTYAPRPRDIERRWYVLDAEGVVLGRLATQAAAILRGKHKPIFAPNADTGDHVIIVNAKGVVLTGQKADKKIAYRHSGYPGGLRAETYTTLLAERPSRAVEKAIRGMLPKNSLGRQMLTKLRVYDGPEHAHAAQQPQALGRDQMPAWNGLPGTGGASLSVVPAATAKIGARRAAKPAAAKPLPPAPKPAAEAPAKPAAAKPAAAKPAVAKQPTAKKPAAKATAKATAKKPAAKSTAKKTTAKKPAAKSTAKKPTSRKK